MPAVVATVFPPPALSRPVVRVVEAHPFRIKRGRFARVTLEVGALRFRVIASAQRVTLPMCGFEEGILFVNPALAAEVERAARTAAVEAHRPKRAPARRALAPAGGGVR